MESIYLPDLEHLTDTELLAQVKHLARCERESTVRLVAHLAEFDARKLYLGEGCASLFSYCVEVLHFSEHAAYGRIQAARAARKFPVVLEQLATGSLNLTTLGLLAPHLTPANHAELLAAADHKSKRQVELLVAALRPQPDVAAMIRRVPEARVVPLAAAPAAATPVSLDESEPEVPAPAGVPAPARLERYKIQFTASAATHAKLRLAQELLRHQIPNGDPAEIIDRALSLLVADLEKRKFGKLSEKRKRPAERIARPAAGRATHIPAEVRRQVWARDGARCAFTSPDGRRCGEGGLLEFHHSRTSNCAAARTIATKRISISVPGRPRSGHPARTAMELRARSMRSIAPQLGPDPVRSSPGSRTSACQDELLGQNPIACREPGEVHARGDHAPTRIAPVPRRTPPHRHRSAHRTHLRDAGPVHRENPPATRPTRSLAGPRHRTMNTQSVTTRFRPSRPTPKAIPPP